MAVAAYIDYVTSQLCLTVFCHRNTSGRYSSGSTSHVKSLWHMIFRGSDSPVPCWWWEQSSRGSLCGTARSPPQPHPPGALALLSSSGLSPIHKLFVFFMSPFAEEQNLRSSSGLEPCGSYNACRLESSAAHSRLSLDTALPIPTPSDLESKDQVCAVQLQTRKKNGVTNVGHLPMHHSTGNLAEQPFSFTHLSM